MEHADPSFSIKDKILGPAVSKHYLSFSDTPSNYYSIFSFLFFDLFILPQLSMLLSVALFTLFSLSLTFIMPLLLFQYLYAYNAATIIMKIAIFIQLLKVPKGCPSVHPSIPLLVTTINQEPFKADHFPIGLFLGPVSGLVIYNKC